MLLSIVIPARNEEENIGQTLDELRRRLRDEGINYEIVVVDDGSSDGTGAQIQAQVAADGGIRIVQNRGPHGYGHAVRRGLDVARGDSVAIVMADGSDNPDDVVRYFYIVRDKAECAFGSRFMRGGRVENYPWLKLVINRLANLFIRALFRLSYNDVTNGFKAYRANVIEGCRPLLSAHFNLAVELPLKAIARGYSYQVVPISWRQRKHGRSALRLQEMGSRYLYIVLSVWLEKHLARADYRRTTGEVFQPWSGKPPSRT